MKKLLSIILSLTMAITMITAFGLSASAAVDESKMEFNSLTNFYSYRGYITIDTAEDLDAVYNTWQSTDRYNQCQLIFFNKDITISKSYDFTKEGCTGLSFRFIPKTNVIIDKNVTIKTPSMAISADSFVNNGTIIIPGTLCPNGAFYANNLTNNGSIVLENTNKIMLSSVITNNGTIQTPNGLMTFNKSGNLSTDATAFIASSSTGSIVAPPKSINSPTDETDFSITMNGATISAPTYTVTIPEKIEFGEVSKKLKNTSDEESIAKTTDYTVSINHSNLFDNQKNVTVTLTTDNKIKNGANEIAFDLYEKSTTDTKITSGTTLFSVKPIVSSVNTTETKTIYATLDQRTIKSSGDYTGTVTFTVSMSDNA